MIVSYNWIIEQLITKPIEGNLKDVVAFVQWRRKGEALYNGELYIYDQIGSMECSSPNETDFTAYNNLTYIDICGWLENGVEVEKVDKVIKDAIELAINPPTIVLPLPWENEENNNIII